MLKEEDLEVLQSVKSKFESPMTIFMRVGVVEASGKGVKCSRSAQEVGLRQGRRRREKGSVTARSRISDKRDQ